ncbi:MAG TPA: phosphatidylserine/phosphatidylglycerophosphate/cardiolipin synthase family protein [Thermoanaerobaculia bacterium]|nr:phosphatidylserine/phosphatidylglycerophosphate/cardiolipin synthase family protein [Thermoanaerobaculia bacterium]
MRPVALLLALTLAATAHADVFRVLDDDREAAQARVDLIQQARNEIDAVYFLAHNDCITITALALLRDARRRGVGSVRLIVDANFQHIPRAVLAHLREEGVEVRVYHPMTFRHPSWLFHRMHEKFVVIDEQRYIAGGRNLAEEYFGLRKRNFVDRDVYVDGPSAAEADRHFEELWASTDVSDLRVRVSAGEIRSASRLLDDAACGRALGGFVALNTGRNWSEGQKDVKSVRFLHDPLDSGEGARVAGRLADVIAGAKSEIVIESPYLVPSGSMLTLLEKKLAEGVRVRIVTNSLRSCDGVLPYAGYIKYRHRMVRDGIDLREYRGPDTLHAKTLVIDGRTVLVGSYNIDPRSQNLNTEVMCVAEDETIAQQLLASIDRHIDNAWAVTISEHRSLAPRAWRFRAWAARLVLPLLEGQL